ncbi:MAG TPA: hypothetical protein PK095_05605, partial [Myxococcota bacterium]|nr:hypothetical protein [Myxococcota bacterium]
MNRTLRPSRGVSRRVLSCLIGAAPLFVSLSLLSCLGDDESTGMRLGESCSSAADCPNAICLAGTCSDPVGDADADGLTNLRETALGTDPFVADTDQDGQGDYQETNGGVGDPPDVDGDGLIDALESALLDGDRDCIPDERDPANTIPETDWGVVANLACCCSGSCEDVGMVSWVATCTADASGNPTLTCVLEGPEAERHPCLALVGAP